MTFFSVVLAVLVIGALLAYLQGSSAKKPERSRSNYQPSPQPSKPNLDPTFVRQHWAEIQQMMAIGPTGLKNALMEADKLLDHVMISKGFRGETMGDRLKQSGSKFSDLNAIWSAHKLRNQIAHEVAIDIVPNQIKDAVDKLGRGIRDLGVQL